MRLIVHSCSLSAVLLICLSTAAPASRDIDWDHKLIKERQLAATNNIEQAEKILDDYLAHHPQSGALHTDKGKCLKRRGHLADARSEFERSTQVQPEYAEAWYELGCLQASDKQWSAAVNCFERYLQMQPDADNSAAVKERINFCRSNM